MRTILIFPKRGPVPEVPEGYEADPGDPYVVRMRWVQCVHRGTLDSCGGCGNRSSGPPHCKLLDLIVDQNTCNSCRENKT